MPLFNPVVSNGTSFPSSPSSGDKFYRSDRDIEYKYDGTRWLSTELFVLTVPRERALSGHSSTTSAVSSVANPFFGEYDIYVEQVRFSALVSGSGDWDISITEQLAGSAGSSIGTANFTASSWANVADSTGRLVSNSTIRGFVLAVTKTSGGNLFFMGPVIKFRLVG